MFKHFFRRLNRVAPQKPLRFMVGFILLEGGLLLFFPDFMARLMRFGPLTLQASGFLRLIGMLVSGFGMLYVLSGRLNAASRGDPQHSKSARGPR